MVQENATKRALALVGKMQSGFRQTTMPPEGFGVLLADFLTFAQAYGGHHLASLPEEQPQDTLVHAIWFADDTGGADTHVALIYHNSTTRFEIARTGTGSGWPDWLTAPVQRATAAAKLNR